MKHLTLALATLAASPAFAHLDPLGHGAGAGHAFDAGHMLASVAAGLFAAALIFRLVWRASPRVRAIAPGVRRTSRAAMRQG